MKKLKVNSPASKYVRSENSNTVPDKSIGELNSEVLRVNEKNTVLQKDLDQVKNDIEILRKLLYGTDGDGKGLVTTTAALTQEAQNLKKDRFSIIGLITVFLSVFTFITVEIKLLATLTTLHGILGFSMIMGGMLLAFTFLIIIVGRRWLIIDPEPIQSPALFNQESDWIGVICLLLIFGGTAVASYISWWPIFKDIVSSIAVFLRDIVGTIYSKLYHLQ
jgi:hypothetical protein